MTGQRKFRPYLVIRPFIKRHPWTMLVLITLMTIGAYGVLYRTLPDL